MTTRLDYSKPPPGYEIRDTSYEDGDEDVGGYGVIIQEWSWIADGYTDSAASPEVCVADAWLRFKEDNDPPGIVYDPDAEPTARAAAWTWHDRRHALADKLDADNWQIGEDSVWPRCLTWSDEQVAAVERWLADGGEMPEVLCA